MTKNLGSTWGARKGKTHLLDEDEQRGLRASEVTRKNRGGLEPGTKAAEKPGREAGQLRRLRIDSLTMGTGCRAMIWGREKEALGSSANATSRTRGKRGWSRKSGGSSDRGRLKASKPTKRQQSTKNYRRRGIVVRGCGGARDGSDEDLQKGRRLRGRKIPL